MKVRMIEMRKSGVAIPRRMLADRYTIVHQGSLVILNVTDQGLRRQVKVARLAALVGGTRELIEPQIVWAADDRFTLTGFERRKNEKGETVDYAQSWLCMLDHSPAEEEPTGPTMRARQR